jgi:hypothetical protein
MQDRLNGVGPNDRPVGKYPGWDRPHDSLERWQIFRCQGTVYEGYKSDCPDYKAVPLGERWERPFDDLTQQIAENVRHNIELQRTAPHCVTLCQGAILVPALLVQWCPSTPTPAALSNPYAAAFAAVCAVLKSPPAQNAILLGTGLGLAWCKETFCKPPSGNGK